MNTPRAVLFSTLILACIFSSHSLQSQDAAVSHEFSLNATTFVQQFALNNSGVGIDSPYLIQYKRLGERLNGFRAGFGINYLEDQDSDQGTSVRSYSYNLDLRMGYEASSSLGDRWDCFYGFDGFISLNPNRVITSGDVGFEEDLVITNEQNTTIMGGGPIGGIRFKITDRIYLFTETTVYFARAVNKTSVTYSEDIFDDESDTERRLSIDLSIPTNLYFAIRF